MASTSLITPAERFARFFDQALTGAFPRDVFGIDNSTRTWVPAVDIRETPEALMVYAEVPGLSRDDIQITLENNVLTLSGERRFEKDTKEQDWHRIERSYGTFSRSFGLPNNVDPEKVEASFKDGVLLVKIAKAEMARPRKIAIK
jgi:HSP20 family protein